MSEIAGKMIGAAMMTFAILLGTFMVLMSAKPVYTFIHHALGG
jgi:hypothetical protein